MLLSEKEKRELHARSIAAAKDKISALRADVEEAQQELTALLESPLPTHQRIQITLKPGDEGYDQAPIGFNPAEYQGDSSWMNARRGDEWPADMGEVTGSFRGFLAGSPTQSGPAIPNPDYKDAPL